MQILGLGKVALPHAASFTVNQAVRGAFQKTDNLYKPSWNQGTQLRALIITEICRE